MRHLSGGVRLPWRQHRANRCIVACQWAAEFTANAVSLFSASLGHPVGIVRQGLMVYDVMMPHDAYLLIQLLLSELRALILHTSFCAIFPRST